jgi:hypothetical protein
MLGLSFHSIAQGDLLVTPTRVVFEGNKQREELNLINTGKEPATFSISLIHYNMSEDGTLVIIEKPDSGQMFADPFLRFFPRQVTLVPGEPQVIMLQCRRTADMLAGEYRSHLYLRAEKDNKPLGTKNSADDNSQLSVQVIPIFGMSIPVIIRSGAVNVTAALTDLKLETQQDNIQNLKVTIKRTGNSSLYGNLIVEYIPAQGKPYRIGNLKGVGVYTNISKRNVSVKLNETPDVTFKSGKLKVRYTSPDDAKYVVYAEAEMEMNK